MLCPADFVPVTLGIESHERLDQDEFLMGRVIWDASFPRNIYFSPEFLSFLDRRREERKQAVSCGLWPGRLVC